MEGDSNGNGGDYREEEALLLKALSETKYKSRDIASALKYARRAIRVFPSLPGIEPLVSSLRILGHFALSPLPQTQPDYYGILQLEPFSDLESVRRQYKSLALMLHPDKNPSFVCQDAFKAVGEALRVMSDSKEKERYDLGLRVRMQEEGLGKGGDVGFGSEGRFWSRCGECGKLHDFEKGYAGKRLVCAGCGKTFKAVGVGDETDLESEETDEDPGIVAGTSGLKETSGGGDRVVKSGDIIYVRKRKGIANKFGESSMIGKRMREDGNSGGRVVGAKKVKREWIQARDGYSKGLKGGSEMDEEEDKEEEEGFWDLKLKDGLKKGKKVETSGGWWSKLKVSVKDDETKNDGEEVRSHVVSGLKVLSRNVSWKAKSGKKQNTRDMEEEKPVVVIGLRCMTEEDRQKIAKLSDKGSSDVHQSPKAVVVGGSEEWGGSRRRSVRVLVKSAEESALILVKKSNASREDVMTLAEMQSRLIQKTSGNRRRTSNQKKKLEKEKEREEAEVKLADGGDENEDERVVEQIREDGEEELRNNEKDAVKANESKKDDDDDEPEKMREEEEKASGMDEEREIATTSVKEGDDDEPQDQENVNKEDKKEMEFVFVTHERSEDEKGKGGDQADMTGNVPIHMDGTTERGTWGNGNEVEETTTDARWANRIRCYETKRRALLKRSKDSGVEIRETPGPPNYQSSLAIIEQPIVTKSRSVRHTVSSNSDFYNFDKDRGERNFKMGQVWAVYDEFGLPRRYGLIEEVVSINPFSVHLKWLGKQDMKGQDPTAPCSTCGRFKVTTSTTVQSVAIFSHEVDGDKVGRETYDIYPKKDSVWAIYGGGVRNERYDIVVCLTSYIDMFGLSLAYVEKVEGFRTVYKRKEFGWHAVRWLGKDEIFLLSHQVPARRLSHEDGSDFEEDCWVLDPASIPPSQMV